MNTAEGRSNQFSSKNCDTLVSFRILLLIILLFTLYIPQPVLAVGGAYSITFTAADPRPNNGPFEPTYERVTPDGKSCPTPSGGRANKPLLNAVYADPESPHAVDSVTSMAPGDMVLGQIVPFEIYIEVNGDISPEGGVIQFKSSWSTETTPGDNFGYDGTYGVYCAFVDYGDAQVVDLGNNATVDWYHDALVGVNIEGEFQISGLDDGDEIIVEVWMVLDSELPEVATGNVPSGMVSAQTVTTEPDTINVGTQTIPLLRVDDFYNETADLSIAKGDIPNIPLRPLDTFDYLVSVTNNSLDTVSNGVVITDTLDIHTQFISAEIYDPGSFGRHCVDPQTQNNGDVFCDLKSISPQETIPVTITVKILETAPRASTIETGDCEYGNHNTYDLCNEVTLDTTITEDENLENNYDTEPKDVIAVADLGIIVICPGSPIFVNQTESINSMDVLEAEFIVKVTNYGPDPSAGVVMTDTLPANTTLINYVSTHPATELNVDPLVLALNDPLQLLDTWTITITLDVTNIISNTTVTITNTAEVSAETPEPDGATAPDADFCQVTPVNLAYFYARTEGGRILIDWKTSFETGNLGFNLYYRIEDQYQIINSALIPSNSLYSSKGGSYSYSIDIENIDYLYLETVDAFGRGRMQGPYRIGVPFGVSESIETIEWKKIWEEHTFKARDFIENKFNNPEISPTANLSLDGLTTILPLVSKRPEQAIPNPVKFQSFDMVVNQTGMYRITFEDLLDAGFDFTRVDAKGIALINRGVTIPIYLSGGEFFGPGSYFDFYGERVDSIYTIDNIYTIVNQGSLASYMRSQTGFTSQNNPPERVFIHTVDIDNNLAYSMGSPDNDPWFEADIRASLSPAMKEFKIDVDEFAGIDPVKLRFNLWGMTDQPSIIDHHIRVSLNGTEVLETNFDGIVSTKFDIDIPANVLTDGENILNITSLGDTGVDSVVAVNEYSLTYPRKFYAHEGQMNFRSSGENFQIIGFNTDDIYIYRISPRPAIIQDAEVSWSGGNYQVKFTVEPVMATYFVTEVEGFLKPASIQPANQPADLFYQSGKLLIISHPDFLTDLQPFIDEKIASGLTVNLVNVEDIYSYYSSKVFDPKAIQAYIKDAVNILGTEYVLLVGADTYDYLDYGGIGAFSFIPSLYSPTHIFVRHSPADNLYGDIDGDMVPEIPVGRFPVRLSSELLAIINKSMDYEAKPYLKTALFVSDEDDGTLSFSSQSEGLIQFVPPGWQVQKAYLENESKLNEVRTSVQESINSGIALLNYIGHSSDMQWSEKGILTKSDADLLENIGKPSVISQWACWNNYVLWPDHMTMAQSLILNESGAAALFGSVTLTGESVHETFGEIMLKFLLMPGVRLGDAFVLASQEINSGKPGLIKAINGYSLLGDPTILVTPTDGDG